MRHEPQNNRPLKPDSSKRLRLLVEKLESRRLLAGLNVSVTIDSTIAGDWSSQSSEAAAGRILYIDLDQNGQIDSSEPVAITNELGRAFFEGLAAGDYSIGLVTDNVIQRQLSPSTMQTTSVADVPVASRWIVGDPSASDSVWGLSPDGILSLISNSSQANSRSRISILELGGEPTSVIQKSASEAWISYRTGSQSNLAIFNLTTKELTNLYVSGIESLSELATNGETVYGVMRGVDGARLVAIDISAGEPSLSTIAAGAFNQIATLGDKVVTTVRSGNDTLVQLRDASGTVLSVKKITGVTSELKTESSSSTIVAVTPDGIVALRPLGNSLKLVAQLAEASGPIAIAGGRLVSSERTASGSLTIWNTSTWQPVSRLSTGSNEIQDLAFSLESFEAYSLTSDQFSTIELASSEQAVVKLSDDQVLDVEFSVQQLQVAQPLAVPAVVSSSTQEDHSAEIDLRQEIVDDAGQTLWYSVLTGPQHGRVQLDAGGQMTYSPSNDYFGNDSVTIRVYDGQASADVLINWNVVEVNRPPSAILVNLNPVAESLPAGTVIGSVSIVDSNSIEDYRITTSDYRFAVVDGNVILTESLDFESASAISLELTAVDSVGQFSISANTTVDVANIVEAPVGVVLSELSIQENVANVSVGKLFVISPDAEGVYEVTVDDPRFAVSGDELIVVEPLNHEQASTIPLKLTVVDKAHPGKDSTTEIDIQVSNVDDAPTQIVLSALNVEEKTPGAAVGQVSVLDDDGDQYQFFVSDPRFQVVDGILQLSENSSLDRSVEQNIVLSITAVATHGARMVVNFPLNVIQPRSPWQNPNNPSDVNGDGVITPRDAINVINFLNDNGPGATPPLPASGGEGGGGLFPDVNGDGRITPLDALIIINALNRQARARINEGEGEADPAPQTPSSPSNFQVWSSDDELRRRNNTAIDAELEKILDQLADDSRLR